MSHFQAVYVPVGVPTYHMETAQQVFEQSVAAIRSMTDACACPDSILLSTEDVEQFLDKAEPDLVIFQNITFANAAYMETVLHKTDCPVLLWTLPEPAGDGGRLRLNSLTGTYSADNMMNSGARSYEYLLGAPDEEEVRAIGRSGSGVRGISIEDDDEVIGAVSHDPDAADAAAHTILVVSENGFGKRSDPQEYRLTSRGAKGVKTINITEKTGPLVAIKNVTEENDLMIITKSGLTIRMAVSDIRIAGRATQGVRLINIREGDAIAAVSPVAKAEVEEETPEVAPEAETTA